MFRIVDGERSGGGGAGVSRALVGHRPHAAALRREAARVVLADSIAPRQFNLLLIATFADRRCRWRSSGSTA
jgi:hypothetical protein